MKREEFKIISTKELVRIVNKVLSNHHEVILSYLFGSYVLGNKNEFSDIDIGILLDREFKRPHLYQVDLSLEIEKEFDNKIEIDLCILNNATPRFLYNVIKNGYIVYSKDDTIQHEFEIRILYEYLDIKPILDMHDNLTIMDVLED